MKSIPWLVVLAMMTLGAGVGVGADPIPPVPPVPPVPPPPALPSPTVFLVGTQFVPAALVVPLGTTVTWQFVESPVGIHTVTRGNIVGLASTADGGFDQTLATGSPLPTAAGPTFQLTFNQPGLVTYFCRVHDFAFMRGAIEVLPA